MQREGRLIRRRARGVRVASRRDDDSRAEIATHAHQTQRVHRG